MTLTRVWMARVRDHINALENSRITISKHIPKMNEAVMKRAAILVPLCNRHGKPSILYTVRTNAVGTHKGQVAFPGGHIDAGETPIGNSTF
jgi:hypothetical protein